MTSGGRPVRPNAGLRVPVGSGPRGRPYAPRHGLGADYANAWHEWSETGDAIVWDAVVGDGLAR